ncbi:MAG: M23 family metallopeptidase [Rhodospirillales bacterium]|nr:M23 family metallopeptidase [Rhodospirillales bacterium]MSP81134.1 M23 family metallopeptidase [Rhodospirillales bacterium]
MIIGAMNRIAAFTVLATLSACGWAEWPPPGQQPPASARTFPRIVAGGENTVAVQAGESLYGLARRHKVPPRAIIEANGLKPPYQLFVGQRLAIPSGTEHEVKLGETIHTVASRYGADPYDLARVNGIRPPYALKAGEKLMIPTARAVAAAAPAMAPAPAARPPGESAAIQPIPPSPLPPPATEKTPALESPITESPMDSTIGGTGRLAWPVRGRVISNYGVKEKGLRNDGINIAAPKGAPVRAADNGTVAYAGNELRGFGNLLLIRHASGLVTAYAHADQILVKRDDTVRRGQIVARVGNTGGVPSPQLHFEVRHGRRAVDPERYLEKG